VAVFTLGSPSGWRTDTGIDIGDILSNPRVDSNSRVRWELCSGYGARSNPPAHGAVTSILTQGAAVYGFALTRPSVSPCA
jgi:hypothetical protein